MGAERPKVADPGPVLEKVKARGRSIGWNPSYSYIRQGEEANAEVALEVDEGKFKSLFFGTLGVSS